MTHQIARLSLHQNAKVIGILMACMSAVLLVPMALLYAWLAPAAEQAGGRQLVQVLIVPLVYLVAGYVLTVICCVCYNFLVPFVGGLEYQSEHVSSHR